MEISREELDRRLEAADRARLMLRRATLEWSALGVRLLTDSRREPRRPDRPDGRSPLRVVTPEDFVSFKALSTRERDVEDASAVVRHLGDRLDVSAIEREVGRVASEIPDHDVEGRLRRILDAPGR